LVKKSCNLPVKDDLSLKVKRTLVGSSREVIGKTTFKILRGKNILKFIARLGH
jgi:hypothetical protein